MPRKTGNRPQASRTIRISQAVYDLLQQHIGPGRTYDDALREALEDAGFDLIEPAPTTESSSPPGEE